MNIRYFLVVIYISFPGFRISAQEKDSLPPRIVTFPKALNFYTQLFNAYSQVEVSSYRVEGQSLLLKPNSQMQLGLGVSYSWFWAWFAFSLPSTPEFDREFGKTKKFDFELHYTTRRSFIDITVKHYKGFYIANTYDLLDGWDYRDETPKVPSLETVSIALSYAYVFRPDRFSADAAYSFTDAMRRSGGSWVLGAFASVNGVFAQKSILPVEVKPFVDPNLDLKQVGFSNMGLSFGYSHLFTLWRKFFISLSLLPGVSYQRVVRQSALNGSVTRSTGLSLRNITRFSLGRNGDRFYWGVTAYFESSIVDNEKSQLLLSSGSTAVFFGYRLGTDSWRFMRRVDRWLHPRFLRFLTGEPPVRD